MACVRGECGVVHAPRLERSLNAMQEVPSILSSKDALRKRLTQEVALKEAAVAARARVFWKKQWEQQALPVTTSTVLTMGRSPLATSNHAPAPPTVAINAVYSPMALDEGWATPSLCGIRRDRLLFLAHSAAAILHGVFAITALLITAQSNDPYLQTWRQQFLFVRNTTTCGRDSLFNETAGEDPITAVMVPAGRIHVGLASAFFFILSCAFSLIWVAALTYDPLGRVLLGWLSNAYAPLRWCASRTKPRRAPPCPRLTAASSCRPPLAGWNTAQARPRKFLSCC